MLPVPINNIWSSISCSPKNAFVEKRPGPTNDPFQGLENSCNTNGIAKIDMSVVWSLLYVRSPDFFFLHF